MDTTFSTTTLRSTRTLAIATGAVIVGFVAWKLIRPIQGSSGDAAKLSSRSYQMMAQFAVIPNGTTGRVSAEATGIRVQPGGELRFDVGQVNGLLHGRFQAVDQNTGATIELQALDAQGHNLTILRRTLLPAAREPSDASPMHFFTDPSALPPGTRAILLAVPADSPSPADWTQVNVVARETFVPLRRLPLPLLAYEGFAEPFGDEHAIFAHAPMQFILKVPPGQYGFNARVGYNPSAFTQPEGHSDGMDVSVLLESPRGSQTLLTRSLDPQGHAEDRALQPVNVTLECPEPSLLRLLVTPGANGSINWDWAMWSDLQVTRAAKP